MPGSSPPGATSANGEAPSDEEALQAYTRGDPEAFGILVRRHGAYLLFLAGRYSRCPEDAADAVQDGLLKAMGAAAGFAGRSTVRTWLSRIVVNAATDRRRAQILREHQLLDEERHGNATGADVEHHVVAQTVIRTAMATIPAPHRAALILVDLLGLSIRDAAGALGIAPGTVKSRRSRARQMLAAVLTPADVA